MTVSGCFRVLIVVEFNRFWPAVNVFTVWRFFNPFFGLSRGLNDLFFLQMHINVIKNMLFSDDAMENIERKKIYN